MPEPETKLAKIPTATEQAAATMPAVVDSAAMFMMLRKQAVTIHESGLFAKRFEKPEQLLAVMLRARELGMDPIEGASQLYTVPGTGVVSIQSQGMLALILRSGKAAKIEYPADLQGPDKAACYMERSDGTTAFLSVWTLERAGTEGLSKKDVWQKHPQQMLRAKAIAEAARVVFPDVIGGLYAPEEFGVSRVEDVTPALVSVRVAEKRVDHHSPTALTNGTIGLEGSQELRERLIELGELKGLSEAQLVDAIREFYEELGVDALSRCTSEQAETVKQHTLDWIEQLVSAEEPDPGEVRE